MNLFDRMRRIHLDAFARGQAMIAHDKAAADFAASQPLTQEAAKAAVETINLANELAADNDPYKKEIAEAIRVWAVGGVKEVVRGQLPADDGKAIEDHPFSGHTETSANGLSDSPKAKPLPLAPPSQPPSSKRRPGRPRKSPQGSSGSG